MTNSAETCEKRRQSLEEVAVRQQHQASDPTRSVWVEASAGTGKTKVLTDRVLRLFLEGVRPDQILCLTYTKAAAVEMNGRLAKRLSQWAVMPEYQPESETDLYREIKKLTAKEPTESLIHRARTLFAAVLDIPGGVKIQTIHSFCQDILKRFPLEAGIVPYFSIMDDRTVHEILQHVSRELIWNIEQNPHTPSAQAMLYLTQNTGEMTFSDIMKTLSENRSKILKMLSGYADFDDFLFHLQNSLGLEEIQSDQEVLRKFADSLDRDLMKKIAKGLAHGSKTDQTRAEGLAELSLADADHFDYAKYKDLYLTKKLTFRQVSKDACVYMPDLPQIMSVEADMIARVEATLTKLRLYRSTRAIMTVAGDFILRYQQYKRKNARLDYEDLINDTRALLENKEVADWILYKLDSSINHILIDEAQDTAPDPWAIIRSLSEDFFAGYGQNDSPRTVFVVGDRKQSIYSFQGADPTEFDAMRRYFANKTDNFDKVRLDVSFRSTEAVLETVNRLFALEQAKSGVVIDQEKVEHLSYRVGQAGHVEIWPLVTEDKKAAEEADTPTLTRTVAASAPLLLARQMAHFIKQTVEEKTILPSQNRPIRYGDFMILVQRRNAFVNMFIRECKNIGVEIAGIDKLKLLEQIGVEDMLSLGRFLLLPEDDLSLAEVLKSPLFGLNDDDLFKLCYQRRGSLWQSLRENGAYGEVVDSLSLLLDKVDYIRPFELFDYVLTTLRGRRKFAERLGAEAEDALDEFLNSALVFEQEHIPDLQGFILWMTADDQEIKREQEQSGADMVRVMTVHGSKGLQAPIVMLPDTTRVVLASKKQNLLWKDSTLAYFPLNKEHYDDCCIDVLEHDQKDRFDEYRRLLYVALTRAEDRLYICGYANGGRKVDDRSWYALCREALESQGISEENGKLTVSTPQIVEPKDKKQTEQSSNTMPRPEWFEREAPRETPLSKPYMPSHADEDDNEAASSPLADGGNRFRRGLLIHRILQSISLPSDREKTAEYVRLYLKVNAPEMTQLQRSKIESEILNMYDDPKLAFLFGDHSYAEVPVAGEADGRIVSGQIDRLFVGEKEVRIVDFKTNRPAALTTADVPQIYLKQLSCYKQLIARIYPQKDVKTYILWTNTLNLMEIV
jgi:ATP-dependent helicase/nuclease subunit A